ncbi:MAG: hypothetical protein ACO3HJ_00775 [Methylophilaceae bacterium]
MKEIKNPLVANIDRSNGDIEISIAKKYKQEEEAMYKSFMSVCSMEDKELVDTSDMDDEATAKTCGMQYDKMRAMINEEGKGGLTEQQKKLPPALQKAILEKMKKEGKLSEEAEAAYSKLLSKDDQKKKEVGPEGEMKVVKNKDA